MDKKAEIDNVIVMFLIVTVVVILLIFGMRAFWNTYSSLQDVELADFANALGENVKQRNAKGGSAVYEYHIPSKVKTLVVIDTTNKKALLHNDFIKKHPLLQDIIETEERKNMFLLNSKGDLLNSFYIGKISLGQFGDQSCTGVGIINITDSYLELRITKKGGEGLFLGEECEGLRYMVFQEPFNDMPGITAHVALSSNEKKIQIAENKILMVDYQEVYFKNGTINSTEFDINSSQVLDRFYFNVNLPDDTDIKFRMGYKDKMYGGWSFFGPNLTAATSMDPGYYYEYPGQYIVSPDTTPYYPFTAVKVAIYFYSSTDLLTTPSFSWLKVSYFIE